MNDPSTKQTSKYRTKGKICETEIFDATKFYPFEYIMMIKAKKCKIFIVFRVIHVGELYMYLENKKNTFLKFKVLVNATL